MPAPWRGRAGKAPHPAPLTPARRRLARLMLAALMLAAIALSALFLLPERAPLVAQLGAPDSALRFEVRHDGAALRVTRVAGPPAPAGQAHQAWLLAPDAAPVALGLVTDPGLRVAYPAAPAGWTLVISLEPAEAATNGSPAGPIVARGTLTEP